MDVIVRVNYDLESGKITIKLSEGFKEEIAEAEITPYRVVADSYPNDFWEYIRQVIKEALSSMDSGVLSRAGRISVIVKAGKLETPPVVVDTGTTGGIVDSVSSRIVSLLEDLVVKSKQ